jgi:CheY-like chemotaxis protein
MNTPAFNILLVDDDAALTQMLAEYLEGKALPAAPCTPCPMDARRRSRAIMTR